MYIISSAIKNNILEDKYGKRGSQKKFGMPTLSFPLKIFDYPKETKSFALIFDDPDSVKVCGKIWIHWLVANLKNDYLDEDDSLNNFNIIQGKNSWNENCYGGPCPPDRPHNYRIRVYALSSILNLRGDFSLMQLEQIMNNKILDQCELLAKYKN